MRELHRDSFEIRVESNGRRYVKLSYNEVEKTRNGIDQNVQEHEKKMYEEPTSGERCPVKTLDIYLTKLNPSYTAFFQRCNPRWVRVVAGMTTWLWGKLL